MAIDDLKDTLDEMQSYSSRIMEDLEGSASVMEKLKSSFDVQASIKLAMNNLDKGEIRHAKIRMGLANIEKELILAIQDGKLKNFDVSKRIKMIIAAMEPLQEGEIQKLNKEQKIYEDIIQDLIKIDVLGESNYDRILKKVKLEEQAAEKAKKAEEERLERIAQTKEKWADLEDSTLGIYKMLKSAITTPLVSGIYLAKQLWDSFVTVKDTVKEIGLGLTGFVDASKTIASSMKDTAKYGATVADNAEAFKALAMHTGNVAEATAEATANVTKLKMIGGVNVDEAVVLNKVLKDQAGGSQSIATSWADTALKLARANKVAPSAVFKDLSANSKLISMYGIQTTKQLIQASIAAKKLGVEFNTIIAAQEKLLDIDASIEEEMQASALIGRTLNLSRLRQAMFDGRILDAQKEQVRLLGSQAEWIQLGYYGQKALAGALGLTVEEAASMIAHGKEINNMTSDATNNMKGYNAELDHAADKFRWLSDPQSLVTIAASANLLFGGISSLIKAPWSKIGSGLKSLGTLFGKLKQSGKEVFSQLGFIKNIFANFGNLLKSLKSVSIGFFSSIKNFGISVFSMIRVGLIKTSGLFKTSFGIMKAGILRFLAVLKTIQLPTFKTDSIKNFFSTLSGGAGKLFKGMKSGLSGFFGMFKKAKIEAPDTKGFKDFFSKVGTSAKEKMSNIKDIVSDKADAVKEKVKKVFQSKDKMETQMKKADAASSKRYTRNPIVNWLNTWKRLQPAALAKFTLAVGVMILTLPALAWGLKKFADVPWTAALTGMGSLFLLALSMKMIGNQTKGILQGSIALGILSLSLTPLAYGLKQFSDISWKSALTGMGSLLGLTLMMKMIGNQTSGIIKGALALAIMSAALIPAAYAFSLLSGIDWKTMLAFPLALGAIALGVFALGAALTGPQIILFAIGTAALLALGGALIVLGFGIKQIAGGLQNLTSLFSSLAPTISELKPVVSDFVLLAPGMIALGTAFGILGFSMIGFSGALGILGLTLPLLGVFSAMILILSKSIKELVPDLLIASTGFGSLIKSILQSTSAIPSLGLLTAGLISSTTGLAIFGASLIALLPILPILGIVSFGIKVLNKSMSGTIVMANGIQTAFIGMRESLNSVIPAFASLIKMTPGLASFGLGLAAIGAGTIPLMTGLAMLTPLIPLLSKLSEGKEEKKAAVAPERKEIENNKKLDKVIDLLTDLVSTTKDGSKIYLNDRQVGKWMGLHTSTINAIENKG